MRAPPTLGCLLALVLAACGNAPTQLVVLVDTDFRVPEELAAVRARILDANEEEVSMTTFAVATGDADPPTRFALPLSFGVVPVDGDLGRRVVVEVTGLAPGDAPLVTRRARTGFLPNRSLLLPMFLLRRCEDVRCDDGQTCTEVGCVDEEQDPERLDPIDPGDELDGGPSLDASAQSPDGGGDAGPGLDGGARDAGAETDAGSVDGGGLNPPSYGGRVASAVCGGDATQLEVVAPVPSGALVVVTVVYRAIPAGVVSATDSAGNTYRSLFMDASLNPRVGVLVSELANALPAGGTIDVSHPDGRGLSVVAERIDNASEARVTHALRTDFDDAPTGEITTVLPGLLYAIVGQNNLASLSPPAGWMTLPDATAACGGALGNLGVYAQHRTVEAGAHPYVGNLSASRPWTVTLLAFQ